MFFKSLNLTAWQNGWNPPVDLHQQENLKLAFKFWIRKSKDGRKSWFHQIKTNLDSEIPNVYEKNVRQADNDCQFHWERNSWYLQILTTINW